MAFKMRMRRKPNVAWLITSIVTLGLNLLVGNRILAVVGTVIGNINGTPFENGLSFLGLETTGGTWASNSIVGVLSLVAVASFVLSFVKFSMR